MPLPDILHWILADATDDDLKAVNTAISQRYKVNRTMRAASVHIGMSVQIGDLSPVWLNGLHGTIVKIKKSRATVKLSTDSTNVLRIMGGLRVFVPDDVTECELDIPASSCLPATT